MVSLEKMKQILGNLRIVDAYVYDLQLFWTVSLPVQHDRFGVDSDECGLFPFVLRRELPRLPSFGCSPHAPLSLARRRRRPAAKSCGSILSFAAP